MTSRTPPSIPGPLPHATAEVEPGDWDVVLPGDVAKLTLVVLDCACWRDRVNNQVILYEVIPLEVIPQ